MNGKLFKLLFSTLFTAAFSICVSAQIQNADNGKKADDTDYPKTFNENLQKQRIDREKKDYQEMLERGDEALQLSTQLEKTYSEKNSLSADDLKKLDRMEKLLNKIRSELGADGDGDESDDLTKLSDSDGNKDKNYFEKLQSMAGDLVDKLKQTSRFSISVAAIESSNALLKMVKFLKLKK